MEKKNLRPMIESLENVNNGGCIVIIQDYYKNKEQMKMDL